MNTRDIDPNLIPQIRPLSLLDDAQEHRLPDLTRKLLEFERGQHNWQPVGGLTNRERAAIMDANHGAATQHRTALQPADYFLSDDRHAAAPKVHEHGGQTDTAHLYGIAVPWGIHIPIARTEQSRLVCETFEPGGLTTRPGVPVNRNHVRDALLGHVEHAATNDEGLTVDLTIVMRDHPVAAETVAMCAAGSFSQLSIEFHSGDNTRIEQRDQYELQIHSDARMSGIACVQQGAYAPHARVLEVHRGEEPDARRRRLTATPADPRTATPERPHPRAAETLKWLAATRGRWENDLAELAAADKQRRLAEIRAWLAKEPDYMADLRQLRARQALTELRRTPEWMDDDYRRLVG